jgi:transcriptional regulator with XRE-family HTH domain
MISEDDKIEFSKRIKKIIELSGSAEKLANISGMSSRVIGQYLAGKSDPSRIKLIALANAANVNVEWLATGKGPMFIGDREKLNVNLLECFFEIYDDYEKKWGKPIAFVEKAWSIGVLFNFYSSRDTEDETVRELMQLEIDALHELFQIYMRLSHSGIGEERTCELLGDFFKEIWSDKEEAQVLADTLIGSKIFKQHLKGEIIKSPEVPTKKTS